MPFKIVDTFFGARTGCSSFFGIYDEERDRRRFDTYDEANSALEADRLYALETPAPGRVPSPPEDQWRKRFMNLAPVPSNFKWCVCAGEDGWSWQEPYDFEFKGPVSGDCLRYTVFLGGRHLGRVERNLNQPHIWTAESEGCSKGQFVSAYEAACALRILIDDPPKPKRPTKRKRA